MRFLFFLFSILSFTAWTQSNSCDNPVESDYSGIYKEYYRSGELRKEMSFKDGKLHGAYKEYSERGRVMTTAEFKNDRLAGTATRFKPNGEKDLIIQLDENGNGSLQEFDYLNKVIRKGRFSNGYRDGNWKSYDGSGKVEEKENFDASKITESDDNSYLCKESARNVFLKEYGIGEEIPDNEIVEFPDVEAKFPGPPSSLSRYISQSLVYPDKAIDQDLQGKVYLSFVVRRDGSISDVKVERGVHELLDNEAARVIASMSNWIPAESKGKIVSTRCRIPIVFQLVSNRKKKMR